MTIIEKGSLVGVALLLATTAYAVTLERHTAAKYQALVNLDVANLKVATAEKATIENLQEQLTANLSESMDSDVVTINATHDAISKEVSTHVTPKADAGCVITAGTIRVFNDAAQGNAPSGTVPVNAPTPGVSPQEAATPQDTAGVDAASDVKLSEMMQTVNDNDRQCHLYQEQASGWQDWWGQVSAVKP